MRNPSSSRAGAGTTSSSSSSRNKTTTTTTTPCCSKVGLKRGPWTPEEDELLCKYIEKEGEGRWRTLPKRAGLLRCGKSCRLRWMNYLRPSVKRGHIAPDEEDLILRLHRLLGNRWSLIAGRIPGRTDNEIKNYWNTHLSKKLISQGIDPRTHKPLLSNNNNSSNNPNPIPHNTIITTSPTPSPSTHHHHHHQGDASTPPPSINHSPTSKLPAPPNPITDDHEQDDHALISFNPYFHTTPTTTSHAHHLDPYGPLAAAAAAADSDASAMPFSANNHHNNDEQVEDDINYCSDDVFSSFLNSLINDDAFSAHQPHPPSANNNINPPPPPPPPPPLAWGPSLLSSSNFSPNDP